MSVKATIQDQLKGNLDKKFGDNLPIPFIEKVKIEDDQITLEASIYFNLDQYAADNFDSFRDELGDLHFYAMMAYDRVYTNTTGSDLSRRSAYSDIVTGKRSVLSNLETETEFIILDSATSDSLVVGMEYPGNAGNLYDLGLLSDWTLVDTYYNNDGGPVNKLVNTVSFDPSEINVSAVQVGSSTAQSTATTPLFSAAWETGYMPEDVVNANSGGSTITEAGFVTFSSILDLNDPISGAGDYTETDEVFETGESIKHLFGSLTSDLNFVSFFKDGGLNESKQFVYVKADGEIVTDAVQSLNGKYYAPFTVSLPKIVSLFKAVSSPPVIEEEQSALSIILEVNAEDSTLLTQINLYLNTFFEKTSATPLGKYYLSLRKRLAAVDVLVKEGHPCTKQIVTNPIVEDFRGTNYDQVYLWSQFAPAYSENDPGDYIYTPSVYMTRMTGSLEEVDGAPVGTLVVDKGYLFFDYEKALKQQSNLAHLINVQKVEDYFGHNIVTSKFAFETAELTLYRTLDPNTSSPPADPILTSEQDGVWVNNYSNGTSFEDFTTSEQYNMTLDFDSSEREGAKPNIPLTIDYDLKDPEIEEYWIQELYGYGNSYIRLRNFNLATPGALAQSNGSFYKLMCFEFQNILDIVAFGPDQDEDEVFKFNDMLYRFKFVIDDDTLDVFDDLRTIATSSMSKFNEYADIALDHCSYNNTDNVFNQFFIEAVEQKFGTDPGSAPFLYAPLIYNYLLDIFTNAFDGDRLLIFEKTRKLSDTIAPWAGTKDAVLTFAENFQFLIDEFLFASGEDVYAQGGGSYPTNDGPGSWGSAPSLFDIRSTIVEQQYPVGVDLSAFSEAETVGEEDGNFVDPVEPDSGDGTSNMFTGNGGFANNAVYSSESVDKSTDKSTDLPAAESLSSKTTSVLESLEASDTDDKKAARAVFDVGTSTLEKNVSSYDPTKSGMKP